MMHPRVPNVKRRPVVLEAILMMTIIEVINTWEANSLSEDRRDRLNKL